MSAEERENMCNYCAKIWFFSIFFSQRIEESGLYAEKKAIFLQYIILAHLNSKNIRTDRWCRIESDVLFRKRYVSIYFWKRFFFFLNIIQYRAYHSRRVSARVNATHLLRLTLFCQSKRLITFICSTRVLGWHEEEGFNSVEILTHTHARMKVNLISTLLTADFHKGIHSLQTIKSIIEDIFPFSSKLGIWATHNNWTTELKKRL